jgi:type I restriction enzyme S subunit
VPEHWELLQLRRRWDVIDCKHLTVPFHDEGIPLASIREVQSCELDLSTARRTTVEWYANLIGGGREPLPGDLIYCRNVSVGACAYVGTNERFAMGQDVCLIRSRSENSRFLNYFMHSFAMGQQLSLMLIGSTFNRINVGEIKALVVAVPPREEQERIVAYLDSQTERLAHPITLTQREITLMREYRARLIADVVTGKLDVREATARVPDEGYEPPPLSEEDMSLDTDEDVDEDREAMLEEADV